MYLFWTVGRSGIEELPTHHGKANDVTEHGRTFQSTTKLILKLPVEETEEIRN